MAYLTQKEIVDRVWNHFIVNKQPFSRRQTMQGASCALRGDNGAKCAVGLFIPDDVYRAAHERLPLDTLIDAGVIPDCREDDCDLLGALREAHDKCAYGDRVAFESRLRAIATDFGVRITEAT